MAKTLKQYRKILKNRKSLIRELTTQNNAKSRTNNNASQQIYQNNLQDDQNIALFNISYRRIHDFY